MGGLTNGSFLHGWDASSERGVVAGERASTPGLLFIVVERRRRRRGEGGVVVVVRFECMNEWGG